MYRILSEFAKNKNGWLLSCHCSRDPGDNFDSHNVHDDAGDRKDEK